MRHLVLAVAGVLAVTAGCADDDAAREARVPPPTTAASATTTTTRARDRERPLPRARGITVPNAFRAEVYARGLQRPTALAFGPDHKLYAAEEAGRIVRVGRGSRRARAVAGSFDTPLGLAWSGRTLFVSSQGRLDAIRVRDGRAGARRTVLSRLPYGLHQQDNVVVGDDGRLYFGSGSTCNACAENDLRSAAVLSVRPDGSDLQVVSAGLRNPYGLAFHPTTGELYVSVNGRDDLGDSEPAEAVVIADVGRDFGWPDCWPSWREKRLEGSCDGVTPPVAYLEPHSSADGIAFWRGDLYVALWGQYDSEEHGRRVDRVDPETGRVSVFADGFDHPLALAVDPGGSLLVADWGTGIVYALRPR